MHHVPHEFCRLEGHARDPYRILIKFNLIKLQTLKLSPKYSLVSGVGDGLNFNLDTFGNLEIMI